MIDVMIKHVIIDHSNDILFLYSYKKNYNTHKTLKNLRACYFKFQIIQIWQDKFLSLYLYQKKNSYHFIIGEDNF